MLRATREVIEAEWHVLGKGKAGGMESGDLRTMRVDGWTAGEAASVNMVDGPEPSSIATAVLGTGREVNFMADDWRVGSGRDSLFRFWQ